MANTALDLSIIIPCYNEQENLQRGVLDEVLAYLGGAGFSWELLLSDDGSSDGSRQWLQQFVKGKDQIRLLENAHGGKPAALLAGIKAARGEYLLFTDMDQSTPISELEKLLPFRNQYRVVIGSRRARKNFPLYRRIGSQAFKLVRQALLLPQIQDTQCGFKLFQTELARRLFPRLEFFQTESKVQGWCVTSFDVELLYWATVAGDKIKEVPVQWEDRDLALGKKRSYLKESQEMLRQILRVKGRALRGYYRKEMKRDQ